jgi:hypothetical protein
MPSSAWKDRVRSVSSRGPSLVVRCLGCRYPTRIGRLARKTRLLNDHGGTVAALSHRPAQALAHCARPLRWKVRGRPWPTTIETAWRGPITIRSSPVASVPHRSRLRTTARAATAPRDPTGRTMTSEGPRARRTPTVLPTTPRRAHTARSATTRSAATAPPVSSPCPMRTGPTAPSEVTPGPARTRRHRPLAAPARLARRRRIAGRLR